MKKNWKALAAIAAVLIIVAIAVVLINLRPTDQATQSGTDNGMVAGKLGFPVSKINIGEGGTKTAGDSKTPIGYSGTCDSAAQAAANYTPILRDVNSKTWEKQKATLNSLAITGPWIKDATLLGDYSADAAAKGTVPSFEGGWVDQTNVQAGGLFRMVSCEPKKAAVVQVFFGGLGVGKTLPEAFFGTKTMELTWNGDWKISNALPRTEDTELQQRLKDEGPSGGVGGTPTGKIPTFDDALMARYFKDLSKEGWVEYANATR